MQLVRQNKLATPDNYQDDSHRGRPVKHKQVKEQNRHTLLQAIRQLPVHSAPEGSWTRIEQQLDRQAEWTQQLQALPTHQAPAGLWEGIAAELDKPSVAKRRSLRPVWRWAAAAVLALGVSIALFSWQSESAPAVSFHTAMISVPATPAISTGETASDQQMILQELAQYAWLQNDERYQLLTSQLSELNEAANELQNAIKTFGEDDFMMHQWSDLERERDAVVRKLARLI